MILKLTAYAKINMTLEALAKRDDGYHEIVTVLQTISLTDTLTFELAKSLELICNVPSLQSHDNLVLKASNILRETTGCNKGALIHLTKGIPIAAGLGSGATDAAAALLGLNQLWELNLPAETLIELASKLGADVAFFLYGGTALAKGRGEKVTPLNPAPELWMVLLRPAIEPIPDKTARLYSQLNASNFTAGQFTEKLVNHIREGGSANHSLLFNVFEHVAFDFFPTLDDHRSRFLKAGAESVHVAGAGPTLFAIAPDRVKGMDILNTLEANGLEAYLVRTIDALPIASIHDRQC